MKFSMRPEYRAGARYVRNRSLFEYQALSRERAWSKQGTAPVRRGSYWAHMIEKYELLHIFLYMYETEARFVTKQNSRVGVEEILF